ncbi:MAG: prepilin-type N-terminal cleavage/methylation domain-containing protein [Candidatus Riflebacteria bacterium]|nr:prepilin-type N-terminal cleavage/methylation domain-containing protein [Candidatus Riflebacteria bacterium]
MVCFEETLTNRGYSLTEMMVVVCVVAVTASFALPAIDSFMASQKVAAEAENFVAGVRLARYKALQESVLHRLILDLDAANYVNAYKIEACTKYDEGSYADTSENSTTGLTVETAYDSAEWESILEAYEMIVDGSVSMIYSGSEKIIYFYPTGYLVSMPLSPTSVTSHVLKDSNISNIDEVYVIFAYGNARVKVYINAMGVLSSESYTAEEDDESM